MYDAPVAAYGLPFAQLPTDQPWNWVWLWFSLYSNIDINENQSQTQFQGWSVGNWANGNPYAAPGASYILSDGDVVGGSLPNSNLEVDHKIGHWFEGKVLNAYGINATWKDEQWTFNGDLSASSARRDGNWAGLWFKTYPRSVSYNFLGKPTVWASPASLSGNSQDMDDFNWGPDTVRDNIGALALSAKRQLDTPAFTAIEFGLRAAHREKQHRHWEWRQDITSQPMSAYDGLLYQFAMPDLNVPAMVGGDPAAVQKVALGAWNPALATEDPLSHW